MKHRCRLRYPLMGLGALAAAGGALLAYAHWPERMRVSLDRYTVRADRAGLPPAGLVILHLSDFHFRGADPVQAARLARLTRLLAGVTYDIVALTGDLIHDEQGFSTALAFLRTLRPRLGAFTVPGNRDYWESSLRAVLGTSADRVGLSRTGKVALVARNVWRTLRMFTRNERAALGVHRNDVGGMHERLAAHHITPLVNRAIHLLQGQLDLWVAGVDDLSRGQADLRAALAAVPDEALLMLLAHNPDAWRDPAAARAGLILAGHTHGGQIRLPGLGALYRQGVHVGREQAAGWFQKGRTRLFITRGMGESFPFRLCARPQAALIHWLPSEIPGESP